jgi:hypothetical protein
MMTTEKWVAPTFLLVRAIFRATMPVFIEQAEVV